MLFGLLFFFIFLFRPLSASAAVSINWSTGDTPSAHQGDQFDLNVNLTGLSLGSTYYVGAKGGPNSGDCYIILKNGYNGCNGFNAGNLYSVTQDGLLTLRLYAQGASGTYQIYSYLYDSSGNLLTTSGSKAANISDAVPTGTPTLTPTITPTATITPTPKPTATVTPYFSPTPMLPTPEPLATDVPTISLAAPSLTPVPTNPDSGSTFGSLVPFLFIFFGLLLFAIPLLGPKIISKIKSRKNNPPSPPTPPLTPRVEPPLETLTPEPSSEPPLSPPVTLLP